MSELLHPVFHKLHVVISYLSDHMLAIFVAVWLLTPDMKDALGIIGAVGAVVLVLGRNYGMWIDNKVSKLKLQQMEEELRVLREQHQGKK